MAKKEPSNDVDVEAIQADIGDPTGYTNLQTILAILGGSSFDSDNKTLYQKVSPTKVTGTASYPSGTTEENVFELTPTTIRKVTSIWIDTSGMSNSGTLALYFKIDGTNYRKIDAWSINASEVGNHFGNEHSFDADWKITYQADTDEGASVNIPYKVLYGDDN